MSQLEQTVIDILVGANVVAFLTFIGTVLYYSWKDARTEP